MKTTPRVITALELFATLNILKRQLANSKHPDKIRELEQHIDYASVKLELELNDMTLEERADYLLDTFRG